MKSCVVVRPACFSPSQKRQLCSYSFSASACIISAYWLSLEGKPDGRQLDGHGRTGEGTGTDSPYRLIYMIVLLTILFLNSDNTDKWEDRHGLMPAA